MTLFTGVRAQRMPAWERTMPASCSPACTSKWLACRRISNCHRLLRHGRTGLQCWATIPVPDRIPVTPDLGWPVDFAQHYVKGKIIGQGSFGSVYLGIDLHSGKEVAIKVMPKQRGKLTRDRTLQKLVKEVGILQTMQSCRNTVRLLGCFESNEEVMMVTQLCSGGDLQKLSDDHGALPERAVALIAYEVLQVIEECHKHGILHGDVKPANFVLSDRTKNPLFSNDINLLFGQPWLLAIDFGCSQFLGTQRFNKRTGTPVYMAPEIFDRDYHWEADMWGLGIMLYQLYARCFPYWKTYEQCRHAKLDEVAELVADHPIRFDYGRWREMSGQGKDFLERCLIRDYGQRMTVTEALDHDWLHQWLPEEDDYVGFEQCLESMATSSEDEDVILQQQQQQPPPPPQQQLLHHQQQQQGLQQQRQPTPQQQIHRQQHAVMTQQQGQQQQQHHQQKQHSVVLTPDQVQQQLLGPTFDPSQLVGQGPSAYSSSGSSTTGDSAGNGAPLQHQQQQHHEQPLDESSPAAQQAANVALANHIVPGGVQQQQQEQLASATAAVGRRKAQQ